MNGNSSVFKSLSSVTESKNYMAELKPRPTETPAKHSIPRVARFVVYWVLSLIVSPSLIVVPCNFVNCRFVLI